MFVDHQPITRPRSLGSTQVCKMARQDAQPVPCAIPFSAHDNIRHHKLGDSAKNMQLNDEPHRPNNNIL